MRWLALIILGFFSFIPHSLSSIKMQRAGGMDGGGADLHLPYQNAAWFLESKTVTYCIDRHPSFPVTEGKAQEIITEALAQWLDLLQRSGRNDGPLPLSEDFEFSSHCDPSTPLTFYLGGSPPPTL